MTDIHCHILPGVDDGARDNGEAAAMLEQAADAGTRAIVATPHADHRYRFDASRCRELLAQLQAACPCGLRLYSGCEVHPTPENVNEVMRDPAAYAINGGDCILLELPGWAMPHMIDPAVDLMTSARLRVILAHPERNSYIQQQRSYADGLVEAGCYLQLTGRSLNGGFGPEAAATSAYLLSRRLAHFIASDAHGATTRRPGLAKAFAAVAGTYGEPAARALMIDNPGAALAGTPILQMPAAPGWFAGLLTRSSHAIRKQTIAEMS